MIKINGEELIVLKTGMYFMITLSLFISKSFKGKKSVHDLSEIFKFSNFQDFQSTKIRCTQPKGKVDSSTIVSGNPNDKKKSSP